MLPCYGSTLTALTNLLHDLGGPQLHFHSATSVFLKAEGSLNKSCPPFVTLTRRVVVFAFFKKPLNRTWLLLLSSIIAPAFFYSVVSGDTD